MHVGGRSLAVFHLSDGFAAVDNVCRHNGSPVDDGFVEDGCLTCPWHGWRYDLATGDQLTIAGRHPGLRTYPTETVGSEVWVEIP